MYYIYLSYQLGNTCYFCFKESYMFLRKSRVKTVFYYVPMCVPFAVLFFPSWKSRYLSDVSVYVISGIPLYIYIYISDSFQFGRFTLVFFLVQVYWQHILFLLSEKYFYFAFILEGYFLNITPCVGMGSPSPFLLLWMFCSAIFWPLRIFFWEVRRYSA